MTTSFSTRSPSCISLDFTLEFYLITTLCLAENSRTWTTYHSSSIRCSAYFNHISFSSSLKWARLHDGVLIYMGNITSTTITMENRVSLMMDCRMVWYDHIISWSSSAHKPLASSIFFLSPLRITLLTNLACLLALGCTTDMNFVCMPKSLKKLVATVLENWVPLSETMAPGRPYQHIILCQ